MNSRPRIKNLAEPPHVFLGWTDSVRMVAHPQVTFRLFAEECVRLS